MQPKKHFGQNFLKDKAVLLKIIEVADLKPDDLVIEIGPGEGALTEKLINHAGKVIAIEKDKELASILDSRLHGNDKIEIISGDVLKINLPQLIKNNFFQNTRYKIQDTKYKLIANIPYYITSPIIQLFLETEIPPAEVVLMAQREVAERIVAGPGKMSLLALGVQYYSRPKLLFHVSKKSFWPVPEVDSAVIRITPSPQAPLPNTGEGMYDSKNFFRIARVGFAAKRKTLANNLASGLKIKKEEIEKILEKMGLGKNIRAQELSVENWKRLELLISN